MALIIRRRRRRRQRQQNRRFWVTQVCTEEKKQRGEWENLVHELQDDREYCYRYLRMSPDRFAHLCGLVEPLITKQDTNYKKMHTSSKATCRHTAVFSRRFIATSPEYDIPCRQIHRLQYSKTCVRRNLHDTCPDISATSINRVGVEADQRRVS